MNCGIKNAIWYIDVWLHPNSEAFALHHKGQFKKLQTHLKGLK